VNAWRFGKPPNTGHEVVRGFESSIPRHESTPSEYIRKEISVLVGKVYTLRCFGGPVFISPPSLFLLPFLYFISFQIFSARCLICHAHLANLTQLVFLVPFWWGAVSLSLWPNPQG